MRTLFLIMSICPVLVGCASKSPVDIRAQRDSAFVPPAGIAVSLLVFKRESRRWPSDYEELSQFFRDRYDHWEMDRYDRVVFTPQADGSLEVFAVAGTQTNQMTLK